MNPRHVAAHNGLTIDREDLQVITIYETGISKEQIKAQNQYCKRWGLLVQSENEADWIKSL
ncbi:hypothetical protein [Cytobacillus sp. IB215665]|uniref:hypothetical protein n=1 Tax=Cytobacillus sp. IB215665 TaxID=3097357 RepID=UPI002A0CAE3D|nr:hypothetical protein [Cytobacillus sp. IB215665]MDX8367888.1 hypothetical protein [Cytobacillus sp. IB215665]